MFINVLETAIVQLGEQKIELCSLVDDYTLHIPIQNYTTECRSYPRDHFLIMSFTSGWQKHQMSISCRV